MAKLKKALVSYPLVGATIIVGLGVLALYFGGLSQIAQILATLYVSGIVIWTMVGMVKDVLAGNFGLDILAVIAMIATLAVGEYGASIIIVLMLTGGEALEDYAASRARSALTSLLDQTPQTAHLITIDEDSQKEHIQDVPVGQVQVGDLLLVRPSEVVPVDGTLQSEKGTFDEAAITGESLPIDLTHGEEVLSGALNGDEAVKIRATQTAENSQYQQIVSLVQDAEEQKAPVVRVADRFAVPFTVLSLTIAGIAWAVSGNPVRFAEVLVLATPCPLLIAAPVAFMGGLSRSAKNGVIFKGGAVIEEMSRVRSVAFDKTGTITAGRPEVVRVEPTGGFSAEEVLALAAAAEQYSAHILATSIVSAAQARGVSLPRVSHAEEVTGSGVKASIAGQSVLVGRRAFVSPNNESESVSTSQTLRAGEVATYLSVDGEVAGVIVLSDEIRPEAPALINYLGDHDVRNIQMLTGDSVETARAIASQAGITAVHASLRPQEKVEQVAKLEPRPAMMVGDGVNDAPALAAANVGVAMGARGATAAGEAADAVIVADSIWKVADAVAISRHTMRVALTAIWIGIVLSVGLMLVATTGAIPAMAGALTQEFVDLAAILYALRALTGKLPNVKDYASSRSTSATPALAKPNSQ